MQTDAPLQGKRPLLFVRGRFLLLFFFEGEAEPLAEIGVGFLRDSPVVRDLALVMVRGAAEVLLVGAVEAGVVAKACGGARLRRGDAVEQKLLRIGDALADDVVDHGGAGNLAERLVELAFGDVEARRPCTSLRERKGCSGCRIFSTRRGAATCITCSEPE